MHGVVLPSNVKRDAGKCAALLLVRWPAVVDRVRVAEAGSAEILVRWCCSAISARGFRCSSVISSRCAVPGRFAASWFALVWLVISYLTIPPRQARLHPVPGQLLSIPTPIPNFSNLFACVSISIGIFVYFSISVFFFYVSFAKPTSLSGSMSPASTVLTKQRKQIG